MNDDSDIRRARQHAKRRRVAPGYPVAPRAFSRPEIDAYLSGDAITCLLCGKAFKRIGTHLDTIHGVTVDAYKTMYGLPWGTGLAAADTRARYSERSRERMQISNNLTAYRHLAHEARHRRGKQPYAVAASTARLLKANGLEAAYPPKIFDEFLRRIASGRTRTEVCADADMPPTSWICVHMRKDPASRMRYMQTVEALPFTVQAKMGMLGERFVDAVRELRIDADGTISSDHRIAAQLGVTTMTVNKARRRAGIA